MISILGNDALLLSIISYIISIVISYTKIDIKVIKYAYITGNICVSFAFILLVTAFITSDFSVRTVLLHSSTIQPLKYKISASWSSHEGSVLFWSMLLSNITIISMYINHKQFIPNIEKSIIRLSSLIILAFIIFIYSYSNPFQLSDIKNISQGLGLNPLLQDIGLVIHPPILYFGYACYLIPFTYSFIAISKDHNIAIHLVQNSIFFSRLGWLFLTIGISLGSWWAYRELGWGGYWFFDPVENISLMVWISATALHHSLLQVNKNSLTGWTIFWGISTFILLILGTFFIRSDLLVSVHAFSITNISCYFILAFATLLLLISLIKYLLYKKSLLPLNLTNDNDYLIKIIKLGNIFWLLSIIIILTSLIYPSIYKLIWKQQINIDFKYFIDFLIPIILPTILLSTSVYYLYSLRYFSYRIIVITGTSGVIIFFSYKNFSIGSVSIFLAVSTIFESIYYILNQTHFLKKRVTPKTISMSIGHLGAGILVLSISLNSILQNEADFIGKVGDSIKFHKFNITLKNLKYSRGTNYYRQIVDFWIEDNNQTVIISPENRLYTVEQAITSESCISSNLFYDIYIILNKVDSSEIVHAKIYYRPFISLLWIGAMIMVASMLISILLNQIRYNKINNK